MIASKIEQRRVRHEIEKIEASDFLHQFKRNQIGKLLQDLARFAGMDLSIELIHEMNLQSKYNLTIPGM